MCLPLSFFILSSHCFLSLVYLCCVTGAAKIIHVFGYEEKQAQVSCSYDKGYESYEKYLCRNNCGSNDDVLITTTQTHKNRYSISDDTNKQVFTATISNLNQNDAGKYWCGVTRSGIDYYPAEVKLKVRGERSHFKSDDRHCGTSTNYAVSLSTTTWDKQEVPL
uniref:Immunoglobulin V-set domain-containing protein n=1 Tax=Anabas testudineus TaxID=64144 RepID=A0A7N6APB8_ANATE